MSFRIGVDIGGTFTDCVVADEQGERTVAKSLSTYDALEDGVLEAVRLTAEQLGRTREQLLGRDRAVRPRDDPGDERDADPDGREDRPDHDPRP